MRVSFRRQVRPADRVRTMLALAWAVLIPAWVTLASVAFAVHMTSDGHSLLILGAALLTAATGIAGVGHIALWAVERMVERTVRAFHDSLPGQAKADCLTALAKLDRLLPPLPEEQARHLRPVSPPPGQRNAAG